MTPGRFELTITTLKGWCLNQLDHGARFLTAGAAVRDSIRRLFVSDYLRRSGRGRNRTYGVSHVSDLQSAALAARHTLPYTLTGTRTRRKQILNLPRIPIPPSEQNTRERNRTSGVNVYKTYPFTTWVLSLKGRLMSSIPQPQSIRFSPKRAPI